LLKKMIFKATGLTTLLVFILTASVLASTVGKISGVVKDKDTGEPLPGVNVLIKGTNMGAGSNPSGEYFINNVSVGTYILTVTMLGYAPVEVQNVRVSADLTTTINFEITSKAIELGKVITVTAERPLVIKDQTSSLRILTPEDIKTMPTRGYRDLTALQAGVAQDSGGLYIRGGRANEIAYVVDGFSQQDPLTGTSTTAINQNAIQEVEVTTGGFNAEYGKVMSGMVNVVTKEGGPKYTGSVEGVSDFLSGDWLGAERYDNNIYNLSLGGPVIPKNDKLTFFVSGERRYNKDRSPHATAGGTLPNNSLEGWNWQGKFDFKLTSALGLKLGTTGSFEKWRQYYHQIKYDAEHMPKTEDKNLSFFARLNHTVSKSMFYTAAVNFFVTESKRGDGIYFDELWRYARPNGNPRYDQEGLFWAWDDPNTTVEDTIITYQGQTYTVTNYNDEGSVWRSYLQRRSQYWGLKFDITDQLDPHNQLRSGVSFEYHTLRRYYHLSPYSIFAPAGETTKAAIDGWFIDVDNYGYDYDLAKKEFVKVDKGLDGAKHPITTSFYLQDKMEYQGTVVNTGVRIDYINTDTKALRSEDRPLDPDNLGPTNPGFGILNDATTIGGVSVKSDFEKSKSYVQVSPRLGVGYPISDKTLFHISYGKFFQQHNLQDLYVSYKFLEYKIQTGGYFFAFGNPNLKPEQTTAYEIGLTQQLGENSKFDLTAFYKDVKDLVEVRKINSVPNNFTSFRNVDFGTIKGLDLSFTLRRTRGISANANYTLSYATGTGSTSDTQRNIAWATGAGIFPPKMTSALDFDQRHKLVLNLDIRAQKGEGPLLGNIRPLENAGINFIFNANSGMPYTPTNIYNEITELAVAIENPGKINSRYGPWTYRLDFKADKSFSFRNLNLGFFVWVLNLFDRDNATNVYTGSGSPNTTGWLATPSGQAFLETYGETGKRKYLEKENNPLNYDIPRMVRFGMILSF